MDIAGSAYPAAAGTNVQLNYSADGNVSDLDVWTVTHNSDGYYRIAQYGQNVSLDVDDESTANGANVQVWTNNDWSAQQWAISGNANTGYRIKARCSGKYLEYRDSNLSSGTNVQQWAYDNVPAQIWWFISYTPEPVTYTVSYNANGGTGAPESQTKTHDVALTLSSTTPSKAKETLGSYTVTLDPCGGTVSQTSLSAKRTKTYTFMNWNTAANGSGTSYASGGSYTANASVTLYAQWNSSTTTAYVTLPIPTRNGYSFKGWVTGSGEPAGIPAAGGGYLYKPNGNVTLCATWERKTYTITYNANGGTDAPEAQTVNGGEATLSTAVPTREHHRFLGWATTADASNAQYQPGGSYSGAADVTLYAVWQRSLENLLILPKLLTEIEDEAFLNTAMDAVIIPTGVTTIGVNAFGDVAIYGYTGSYAETWAKNNSRLFIPITDDWVLADQMPSGATVTAEKWTYQRSTTETTTSTSSSLSGWTQTGFSWQQTGTGTHVYANYPDGFDTSHPLYGAYAKGALTGSTSGNTKREVSGSTVKDYIYWHWTWYWGTSENKLISDQYCIEDGREYNNFKAYENSYIEYVSGQNYVNWDRGGEEDGSCWWFRFDVLQQSYTDYQKLYSYTRTVTSEETSSSPVTEGNGISNVQHWVKYTL